MVLDFSKSEDFNELKNIPIVEGGISFDATKYRGHRIRIEKVSIDKNAINWYTGPMNEQGMRTYNPNSTETMWKVVVETYPLSILDDDGNPTKELLSVMKDDAGQPLPYRVSARFNLVNRDGVWSISKAPRAKLWPFMRKLGARDISELKDKFVVLDVAPDRDEKSDRVWLRISI